MHSKIFRTHLHSLHLSRHCLRHLALSRISLPPHPNEARRKFLRLRQNSPPVPNSSDNLEVNEWNRRTALLSTK